VSDPGRETPASPIRESPRELLAFVTATRPDWGEDETWTAILACKTAGFDWSRIALGMVILAHRDETPPTRPRELWDDVRGLRDRPKPGVPLDPDAKAAAIAACRTVTDSRRHGTGGQPVLAEGRDP
jgi:hypothetical protein